MYLFEYYEYESARWLKRIAIKLLDYTSLVYSYEYTHTHTSTTCSFRGPLTFESTHIQYEFDLQFRSCMLSFSVYSFWIPLQ